MRLIFLVVALLLAGIATVIGFQWLGTNSQDQWPGWISAAFFFLVLAFIVGDEWVDSRIAHR